MFDGSEQADLHSEGQNDRALDSAAAAGVDAAMSVLSTMAALPASAVGDRSLAEATLALERARRFLDAAELTWLAELDRRGSTDAMFGHRTATWLATEASLPANVASSRVCTARSLASQLEPVSDALRAGDIGFDHARVIAGAANPRNVDDLAAHAADLCALAPHTTFDRFSAEVRGLADQLDADGGHDPSRDLPEPRLAVHRVGDVTDVRGQLAGDGAHIAQSALDQIADELFRAHTRDHARTGEPVPSRPQLLAEAFVELCRRGLATDPASSRPPRAEATIVINALEPDRVTDSTGTRLLDTDLLLCDPLLQPIITRFDAVPLAAARAHRLASPHQVRAVNLRDGGCVFPGCTSPTSWNETHHADPWGGGGHTDTDRMCGLCRHHHRLAHRPGWQLLLDAEGWTRWTRPDGRTFWGQRHQRQRAGPLPDDSG